MVLCLLHDSLQDGDETDDVDEAGAAVGVINRRLILVWVWVGGIGKEVVGEREIVVG